ncbi:hypothetical protein G4X40_07680 [Rhodococcus sp. D2-41]|uniref:Uncharacterized protein n=1 Tax=Speluncibacter jeojiensis TaxID=2710754 RepID=A0A9X4M1U7_9ACTN|nr:hypothetical protein [Rhodococcus sp. D2-41]MDG3010027.1 hypothetical protein [Rhodococcus sp. D2-41]MDG3016269.1 hypothetical protein [Corynebacteriales bacterium D3-21]
MTAPTPTADPNPISPTITQLLNAIIGSMGSVGAATTPATPAPTTTAPPTA